MRHPAHAIPVEMLAIQFAHRNATREPSGFRHRHDLLPRHPMLHEVQNLPKQGVPAQFFARTCSASSSAE